MPAMEAKAVHLSIDCNWQKAYDFASNPQNMARWAFGLGAGLVKDGDDWLADGGPLGEVRVTFAPPNTFGVIDHVVRMPTGLDVHNAFRIVPNGTGCEAIFLVTRLPGMDRDQFEQDAAQVMADLQSLKRILESGARGTD